MQSTWHALSEAAAAAALQVEPRQGLNAAQVAERRAQHGRNALPEPPPRSMVSLAAHQFRSPLIYLLLAAALLALALGHARDAGVILLVVLVNAAIGTVQEGRAERSMSALRRLAALQVRVLRDGQEQALPAADLVPGDVLLLAAGDAVGADARLMECAQLQVAEATLTGESAPVAKALGPLPEAHGLADRHNMVFAGTQVSAGRGRALVVAIGPHTEVGGIARLTSAAVEPPTPLEQRLARLGRALVVAALALFVLVLLLGLWRQLPLSLVLMVAISQMVSMVPEGLPVAMTIALAVGMQRMAARGALIRRLSAVETLGSTTTICSDKTGTLTRNEMTAVALWLPTGQRLSVQGSGYAPVGAVEGSEQAQVQTLLRAALLCNDAELLPPEEGERNTWQVLGDPTEGALLVLAAKAGLDLAAERNQARRRAELPFDSETQMMATLHADGGVWIKGAPEAVLGLCPPAARASALAAAAQLAGQALRVLAFARVAADALEDWEALRGRAQLLGLVGQIDPPRDEARAAVAECQRAGIRVLMVTGDHKLTGLAIARQLGIAGPDSRALDGQELACLNEGELQELLPEVAVFARVQPAQKLRIVEALQARGEVVAMTGDGVNDAPALARADVGVAMGLSGTEVAKSAAKIVVTDDNFASIVGAVEQGRVVYGNLKKLILYLFATSLAEVLLLLLALMSGLPLPLAAVQILWINLVTEGTVTVNLVMDPPDGDEMRRRPVPRNDRLLSPELLRRVALMTPLIAGLSFAWFAWRLSQGADETLVRTETFTLLAMCQWFNVLNCQSATRSALRLGLLRNPWLLGGLSLSVLLQAAVLYWTPLATLFHTQALPAPTLLQMLVVASVVLLAEEGRKAWARRHTGAAGA
ncbi:cation-translocating P-type ATPase [Inhella gelatinilytica]|nr:HAD-IC family P-type ATPase [Inhella gelatinilytica]